MAAWPLRDPLPEEGLVLYGALLRSGRLTDGARVTLGESTSGVPTLDVAQVPLFSWWSADHAGVGVLSMHTPTLSFVRTTV